MSFVSPPLYWSTGVPFNELFWASSTDPLTENDANLLYLRKTTPDTASAFETFAGGIATNNIATTTLASNLQIGSDTNTGTIFISTIATNNTNTDPAVAIGTNAGVRTIKINNGTNSVHCSSIDMKGSGINNVSNAVGDIDIGLLQTTGDINIGTGTTRTAAGFINIGTGGTAVIPIGIGSQNSSVVINAKCVFTALTNQALLNNLNTGNSFGLCSTQTGGNLFIGSSTTRTGFISLGSATNTGAISLSTLTGDITIGSEQTSGDINIGCFTGRTSAGQINIGTLGTNVIPIVIGQANSTTALNGATTIASLAIDAVQRGSAGTLLLGTTANNTAITISKTLVTTTVAGLLSVSEMATATGGLTMGNGKNMILQSATGYATPSLNTELGFLSTAAITAGSLGGGTPVQQATTGTLQLGTYMVFGYLSVNYGISFSAMIVWITEDNTLLYANRKTETSVNVGAGTSYATNLSYVATNTTGPFKLVAQSSSTGTTTVKGNIWAVRIA